MSTRRGMTVLELSVAGVILLATLAVALQYLAQSNAAWRAMQRETVAMQEAANILERQSALDDEAARGMAAADVDLSAPARQVLHGGSARLELLPAEGEPPMTRAVVRVQWQERPSHARRSVELVGWRTSDATVRPGSPGPADAGSEEARP